MTFCDTLRQHPLFGSPNRVNSLDMLEPVTRAAVQAIMAEAAAAGTPLIVFETYRSVQRQTALFDDGVTQLRTVGVHHYGLAADLVKDVNGQPSWEGDFSFLGPLAKKHGLVWGGDWGEPDKSHSFHDLDHVQRCLLVDQTRLFAGTWYPDDEYLKAEEQT